jgi:hypothetical protein
MDDRVFRKAYERGVRAAGDDWAAACAAGLDRDFVECGVNRGFLSSEINRARCVRCATQNTARRRLLTHEARGIRNPPPVFLNTEFVRKVFALLFRREGGDDLLEARIAAERVPVG